MLKFYMVFLVSEITDNSTLKQIDRALQFLISTVKVEDKRPTKLK